MNLPEYAQVVEMLDVMEEFTPAELSVTAWSLAAMECKDYRAMFSVVAANALCADAKLRFV